MSTNQNEDYLKDVDAVIFTEGKTDWQLIKKAKQELGIQINIKFHEEENAIGDGELFQMCEKYSQGVKQPIPYIFVFDQDNREILKKATERGKPFKDWRKNIFSFALPLPVYRKGYDNISIEFLFRDEDLKLKDKLGRRLFFSTEFDEHSGNCHNDPSLHVGNAKQLKGFCTPNNTKVVDSNLGVFNSTNENIALSKSDFAENIINQIAPFDSVRFDGFRRIFDIIGEIVGSSKPQTIKIESDLKSTDINVRIEHVKSSYIDHPPIVPIFIGRESYMKQFDNPSLRVIAITGLGGEGKSTLATQYYNLAKRKGSRATFYKYGWCDCKEMELTFHERLLALLEELSEGIESKQRFAEENVNDTVRRFVDHLNKSESLIIFDNIDAFVDKDTFSFVSTVKHLFDILTSTLSKGTVLFTCRPAIHDYHQTFLEIPLVGFSYAECRDLAKSLDINMSEANLRLVHERTNGHALYLNLIFGQLRSGRITEDSINETLSDQTKFYSDLNFRLLKSIWNTLNPKEREVICALSVFTCPPDILKIESKTGIAFHKCKKIMDILISMRLVLEIDHAGGKILYDLHPIIRSKAREGCGKARIQNYLSRIVAILVPGGWDNLAIIIKAKDFARLNLENYVEWAETTLEHNDFKDAIKSIEELSKYLWQIGEDAKFIELGKRLFDKLDYKKFRVGQDSSLATIHDKLVNSLLQQGESLVAKTYLDKLSLQIQSIKEYIPYSIQQSYYLWFTNDFENAIEFSRQAIKEISAKNEEIPHTLNYNLGLALRDCGKIDEALVIFAGGRSDEKLEAWGPNTEDDSASDIGNIGRCHYLRGEYDKALKFIRKSADSFSKDQSRIGIINYGYALLWLSDIHVKKGDYDLAYRDLSNAVQIWSEQAPARLKKIEKHLESYPGDFKKKHPINLNIR